MAPSSFNLTGVQLESRHPLDLNNSVWPLLQRNAQLAFTDSLLESGQPTNPILDTSDYLSLEGEYALRAIEKNNYDNGLHKRTQSEIDCFVKIDPQKAGPIAYRELRRHPERYAGKETDTSPSYSESSIITTRIIQEVIVRPEYQHRGIALAMVHLALKQSGFRQPVSATAWPAESAAAASLLVMPGIVGQVEPQLSYPFGSGAEPAETYFYHHPSSRKLFSQIAKLPGMTEALRSMKPARVWNDTSN